MLSPGELTVGCLADARVLSLLLPRTPHEHLCLVVPAAGAAMAVVLDGEYQFLSLPTANNTAWTGVIIPNVAIELDHDAIFNAESSYTR